MRKALAVLALVSLALAAGLRFTAVFPPSKLPKGTVLVLLDETGKALWKSGEVVSQEALSKAAALAFELPKGSARITTYYTYKIVKKGKGLADLEVRIGKKTYLLSTLLKNRHVSLDEKGNLVEGMK